MISDPNSKPEPALADYDVALSIDPNDADLYYNRALAYLAKADEQKAMKDFQKAAELVKELFL